MSTLTHTSPATPLHTLRSKLSKAWAVLSRRWVYGQTVNALSQLSNHDLADLGLSRASIQSAAWEAVYGTPRR